MLTLGAVSLAGDRVTTLGITENVSVHRRASAGQSRRGKGDARTEVQLREHPQTDFAVIRERGCSQGQSHPSSSWLQTAGG